MKDITKYILESTSVEPKFKPGDVICQKGHKWNPNKSSTSYHLIIDIKDDRYILDDAYADEKGNPYLIKYINNYVLADDKNKWDFLHWSFPNDTDKEINDRLEELDKEYQSKNK